MKEIPLSSHFKALRAALIQGALILLASLALCLYFADPLLAFLTRPLLTSQPLVIQEVKTKRIFNTSTQPIDYHGHSETQMIPPQGWIDIQYVPQPLVLLSPMEGLLITFKLSFWIAFFLSSPLWLVPLWQFIRPALHFRERQLVLPFLLLSYAGMAAGLLAGYFFTLPVANQYFAAFNENLGQNLWGLSYYLDYTLSLLFAHALACEAIIVLLFLVHRGILKYDHLQGKRRYAIVFAFVLGALLTPPDVLSQLILALPLILFYEIAVRYSKFKSIRDR